MGGSNVEAVAGIMREPILHDVGDVRGRPDHAETALACDLTIELSNARVLALYALHELSADAAQIARTEFVEWNRTVQGIPGKIAEGLTETRQPNERIKQLLELVKFGLRFGGRPTHDWPQRRQDLQVIFGASILAQSSLDVRVERLSRLTRGMDRIDEISRRRCQFAALLGRAGLHDHGMTLG